MGSGALTILQDELRNAQTLADSGVFARSDATLNPAIREELNPQRLPFDFVDAIDTPAAGSSAYVLELAVPRGYDAIVTGYLCQYTGGGWLQGSDDLTFSISVDGVYYRNFEAIRTQRGSFEANRPLPDGLIARSEQTLRIEAAVSATASITTGSGAKTIAGLSGAFIPR